MKKSDVTKRSIKSGNKGESGMKKRKYSVLLVIAGLLLALSACGKPQSAEMQDSRSVAAIAGEATSAEAALAKEGREAENSGEKSGSRAQGESGTASSENEAEPGQGSADAIHETGQNPQQPDAGTQSEGNTETVQQAGGNAAVGSQVGGNTETVRQAGGNATTGLQDGGTAAGSQYSGENTPQGAAQPPAELSTDTSEVTEELEIHFIDVGQGDCTLLLCGGEAMLIDAGDNDQGTKIQSYLQKRNVETLKYVVCTHPDEDHIGGMDVILYKFDCETIFMTDEEKDTNTYRDVVDTMENRGYQRTLPEVGQQYFLGDAVFTILAPTELSSDSNNNSIALLLVHGDNRFLFTGDAEADEEEEMVDSTIPLEADVYKAGHHGSRTSSSEQLLEAVSPAYVVISCGEGNSYGHPHAETMNHLRAMGAQVFRTDEQGSIVLSSDGSEIRWNCSPSDTWQAGEPTGSSGERPSESEPGLSGERQPDSVTASHGERQPEGMKGPSGKTQSEDADGSFGTEQLEGQQSGESGGISAGMTSGIAPAVTEAPEESSAPETVSYICNINTKKFHYPDCSSVKQMKEKNKLPVNTTRDELINQGYDPCKKCKP